MTDADQQPQLLAPEAEARAFWRVRLRAARARLRTAMRDSLLRLALIVTLSALLWGGLFWALLDAFAFLDSTISSAELYYATIGAILGLFFFALMVMLVFSSGILLYGSLFRSHEVQFLLTLPVRAERVFLHKYQETALFSSWGFVLLGSPMLIAWGLHTGAPWYYFALLPAFVLSFVYIPVSWGAILCILVMRFVPRRRMQILGTAAVALGIVAAWGLWASLVGSESDLLTPTWFREVLDRFQATQGRLTPSWWLTAGLMDAADEAVGTTRESLLFLSLLIANALFFRLAALELARRQLRAVFSAATVASRPRRVRAAGIDRAASRILWFLPTNTRLLIVKDLRLFRRDPMQWSQFLIFVGLLLLYFFNLRRFTYDMHYVSWVYFVSFLNLAVVGLLMSTFTTRFIFPMMSVEGRRFWVLGVAPLRRDTILLSKFFFAVGGAAVPCSLLILLSDVMLGVSSVLVLSHQLTCILLCLGLAGIAVGLGARLPSVREQSPARIAAGFGGTLNLVVSTLYIVSIVLLTALPSHFYFAAGDHAMAPILGESVLHSRLWMWLVLGTLGSVLLGAAATIVPLWIGIKAFRRAEF